MHLRNVEIFCDVVSRRSFSKAAAVHHVSQSSASQAVHQLEKRLGIRLIDRSKRPFELTAAGRIYYDGCRDLLDGFRRIEDQAREAQGENLVAGRVCVAAIYSVGLLQMDAYVKRFKRQHPTAELLLEYRHPDEVYDRVLSDAADLGLVSFPRDGGEIGSIHWQDQRMVLVTPPSHRLAARGAVGLDELDGERFVGFTSDLTIRRKIDRWLRQARVGVDVVHEFDNVETIKRAVEIGAGVSVLPEPTVLRERDAGSLRLVELDVGRTDSDDRSWLRPLGIVHKRNKAFSAAAQKFVDLLTSEAAVIA